MLRKGDIEIETVAIRRVLHELEARLIPPVAPAQPRAEGKLERKEYGDGTERLKISVRGLDVPDGSTALVAVEGSTVTQFDIWRGAGRADTRTVSALPEMRAGQVVEVQVAGAILLSGTLRVD